MTFWIAGAGLAMGAVGMIGGGQTASAQASAAVATTEGQIKVNKAHQANENAKASLSNFMTAFNNNRALTQFGKAKAAAQSNTARVKDNATANKLEQRIQAAEQRGALAANMGFSGASGASFESIEASMRLRNARVEQNQKDNQDQLNYDAAQQQLGLIDNGLSGLDLTVNGGGVANTVAVPQVTGGTNYMSAIAGSGMLNQIGKIAAAWPGSGTGSGANLTGGSLGLTTSGSYGLTTPTASTSFFNLSGGTNYNLI